MSEISVIVPVYNVESYLGECLDSICNQTFKDIEIICVNDGSTDRSLDILNEYVKKDERIKIISQQNQGLGAARNTGFDHANGNYLYFIDSDDYIKLDTLEKLYKNIISNQSDIVMFMFQTVDDMGKVQRKRQGFRIDNIFGDIDYNNFTFQYEDVKKHVMNSAYSACLKLYRKEFIDNLDFKFPVGVNFEDVPVHVKVMVEANRISFVPESMYNYRSNPDSIMNSTANGFDIFKVIDLVEVYLRENDYYDEFENEFIFFKISQILLYLKSENSEEYFTKTKEEFEKITIKNEKTLRKYDIKHYNLVLNSENYKDYIKKINNKNVKNHNKSTISFKNKLINSITNIKF